MATWQDIGIDNFHAAVALYDEGHYRSATSRFYYVAFAVLTAELISRHGSTDFRDKRDTPGHSQLPGLIEKYLAQKYLAHLSSQRLLNLVRYVKSLYRDRLAADYLLQKIDRQAGTKSYRSAEKIFQYLGVNHERR